MSYGLDRPGQYTPVRLFTCTVAARRRSRDFRVVAKDQPTVKGPNPSLLLRYVTNTGVPRTVYFREKIESPFRDEDST
jgi:hypothetical protein